MQAPNSINKDSADWLDAFSHLRVVIAYDDVAAGKRAMRVLADIAKQMGEEIEFEPLAWSFALLADVDWREVAAADAVRADLLIIASNSTCHLPPEVAQWTETAIRQKQGSASAVVALFGPEENPDHTGSFRLRSIRMAAELAGLAFFAPAPRRECDRPSTLNRQRAWMKRPCSIRFAPSAHATLDQPA